jgi:hypothetical protein
MTLSEWDYMRQTANKTNELRQVAYDYAHQAWIEDGRYVRCGHPESMNCQCYGRLHAGEAVQLDE